MTSEGATLRRVNLLPFIGVIVGSLLAVVFGIYVWISNFRACHEQRIGEVEKAQEVLEERVKHLPTSQEVAELTAATVKLTAEMKALGDALQSIGRRLALHEERELEREREDRRVAS